MFVFIEDIVGYMVCLSEKSYFNLITGTFRDTDELNDVMDSSEILIPKTKENDIILLYIQQLNNKRLKRKLLEKMEMKDFDSYFHREITDRGLYEEWGDFRYEQVKILAKKWCEENNIIYTSRG